VQSARAVQGLYGGLADGGWSEGADAAMARNAAKRFASAPLNAYMATLALNFAKARAEPGWQMVLRPRERAAVAAPKPNVTRSERGGIQLAREGAMRTSAFGRRESQLLRTLGMDGRDLDYGDADRRSRAQE
jgi:hypothetical protein